MNRFRRWLFNGVTAVSLLFGVTALIFGTFSNWYMVQSRLAGSAHYTEILSASGAVIFYSEPQDPNYPAHSFARIDRMPPNLWSGQFQWRTLGFDRSFGWNKDNTIFATYTVPYWPVALIGIGWPAWRMIARSRTRHRSVAGHCTICGYDLRATPDRCPECGAIPPKLETV